MGDTAATGSGDVRIFRVVEGFGDRQATAEFMVLIRPFALINNLGSGGFLNSF
jgi:hypothetical protein